MNMRYKALYGSAAAAIVLFARPTESARAAGLLDASGEAFLAADFTTNPSDDITNPWWTMPPGTNALYFAEEDGECAWNLVEVLALTTDNFEGDYAGTDAA